MMTTELLYKKTASATEGRMEPLATFWVEYAAHAHKAAQSHDSSTIWIIRKPQLAKQLLHEVSWPSRRAGYLLLMGSARAEILLTFMRRFERVVYSFSAGGFLPKEELDAVLRAPDRKDRFIGGMVDKKTKTVLLWRGDLTSVVVPFPAFAETANGVRPSWDRFAVTDYGHTVKFGNYEAAADAVLYEYDREFRRRFNRNRAATEQTLGASIRRLRKQRQLTRQDFPGIDPKTLARIERGEVERPQTDTLQSIAKRLDVIPDELGSF
jgi:hypothetical protein